MSFACITIYSPASTFQHTSPQSNTPKVLSWRLADLCQTAQAMRLIFPLFLFCFLWDVIHLYHHLFTCINIPTHQWPYPVLNSAFMETGRSLSDGPGDATNFPTFSVLPSLGCHSPVSSFLHLHQHSNTLVTIFSPQKCLHGDWQIFVRRPRRCD